MRWRVLVSSPNNLFRELPDAPTKFVVTGGFVWAQTEEEAIEAADRAGLSTMFGFKFEGVELAEPTPTVTNEGTSDATRIHDHVR